MAIGYVGPALAAITIAGAVPATIFAGRIADALVRKDVRYHMWLPAIAMAAVAPFSLAALLVPTAANATYVGPVLAAIQSSLPEQMRATAVAIFLFVTNLIGLGAGPVVMGLISDGLPSTFGDDSLRWALAVTVLVNLWAVAHYVMAARFVKADFGEPA